ncbi:hypothetical protein [Leisingera sp.]|uniref:hypothetical protein n=1 Tax=Leisingera sp. TaxID=1879318 RepID=UPI002B27AC4A|nr:hypothetical protein [Leisingera sp.]
MISALAKDTVLICSKQTACHRAKPSPARRSANSIMCKPSSGSISAAVSAAWLEVEKIIGGWSNLLSNEKLRKNKFNGPEKARRQWGRKCRRPKPPPFQWYAGNLCMLQAAPTFSEDPT